MVVHIHVCKDNPAINSRFRAILVRIGVNSSDEPAPMTSPIASEIGNFIALCVNLSIGLPCNKVIDTVDCVFGASLEFVRGFIAGDILSLLSIRPKTADITEENSNNQNKLYIPIEN